MNYELGKEKRITRALRARSFHFSFSKPSTPYPKPFSGGFSLTELLVVIGVGVILTMLVAGAFPKATGREALDKGTAIVLSLLAKARNSTVSGVTPGVFGVHFEATKAVLFIGGIYSGSNTSNAVEMINPLVSISNISLAGGGNEVIFNRLTGQTGQSGTVTISLVADSNQSKTITIFGTGLAQSN